MLEPFSFVGSIQFRSANHDARHYDLLSGLNRSELDLYLSRETQQERL